MKLPVIFTPKKSGAYANTISVAKEHHKHTDNKYQMYCPYCGAPLVKTDRMEYMETLDEHVSCAEPCLKTVYKCMSGNQCIGNMVMFAYTGEMYNDYKNEYPEDLWDDCYSILYNRDYVKSVKGCHDWPFEAINSTIYYSSCNTYCPGKKKEYSIRLWKTQRIVPVFKMNYEYNTFGDCKFVNIQLSYHLYDKDNTGYISVPSIWRQFKNLYRDVKNNYQNYKFNKSDRNLHILYGDGCINRFNYKNSNKIVYRLFYRYIAPIVFGKIMNIQKPVINE